MHKIKKLSLTLIVISFHTATIAAESANAAPSPSIPHGVSESFSLMLSDAEQKMISSAMNSDKHPIDENLTCHYLGGIVYSAPTNWTLWLNDQAYSSESEIPGITILDVSTNGIKLKARESKTKNGTWLEMGNTFCSDTGKTLAGDQRR